VTTNDGILALAKEHGLPDAAALEGALTRAYGCAQFGFMSPSGVPSGYDDQGQRQHRAQQLHMAVYHLRVHLPVTGEADDLFGSEDARVLAKAYGQIADIVCRRTMVDAPTPGATRRSQGARFVAGLASEWSGLTGERPTAWRRGDDHTKTGGRFYAFVCDACKIYNIVPPSPDTVLRIISDLHPA
jgi:hypothetical protein